MLAGMAQVVRTKVASGVTLHLTRAGEPIWVQGDETQLRRVVESLVENASEALTGPSGRIEVAAGRMHADPAYLGTGAAPEPLEPGEYAWVEVSDDGCGMDESQLSRVFDPFYTTKFKGRGLGLAAALGIIRSHRGTVRVESQPGAGTRIRALFPLAAEPVDAPQRCPAAAARPSERRGSILVVDDEASVRSVARRMLQQTGYAVMIARDGAEALARLSEAGNDVSLVLLDLSMPGMDGEATYHALRALRPELPVIFNTGHGEADAANVVEGKPGSWVLHKPYSIEKLRDAIAEALEHGAA
jgi:CheY-like chemotaxis protein